MVLRPPLGRKASLLNLPGTLVPGIFFRYHVKGDASSCKRWTKNETPKTKRCPAAAICCDRPHQVEGTGQTAQP
jgi:hypothetical protein